MNLPNKLTVFRIILVIPLIILFCLFIWYFKNYENNDFLLISPKGKSQYFLYSIALIFIFSMITDFIDGKIARKRNQITLFGKLFDPLADKIIITTTMIFLTILGYTYLIVLIVFIIRDLIVDGARNIAAANNIKVEASIYGKIKTMIQSISIPIIILLIPFIEAKIWWHLLLINIPIIISSIMSIISGILYFKQIFPIIWKDK